MSKSRNVITKEKAPSEAPVVQPTDVVIEGKTYKLGQFRPGFDPRRIGNGGINGRPKSAVRAACREAFEDRIPILMAIADGEPIEYIRRVKKKNLTNRDEVSAIAAGHDLQTVKTEEYITLEWQQSADVKERIDAIDKLGKMGGVNIPGEEGTDDNLPKPVYVIAFD